MTAPVATASTIDEPRRPARRFRLDPVSVVALGLIVVVVGVRAWIASRGFLILDDFMLASRAMESDLSVDHLFASVNDSHVMPAGLLVIWLVTRTFGFAHWPYVVLLAVGYAAIAILFHRLLRSALRPGWALLVPLALVLFSPLSLEATSMALTGLTVLPMLLAMVLAMGAQIRYARTRRKRHLVTLALAMVFGLLFFEKTLLVAPLVFLLTVLLFAPRGPVDAVRRFMPAWLTLAAVCLGYLAVYTSIISSSAKEPTSAGTVFTFWHQLIGYTLVPGLFGGPWQWLPSADVAPLVAPEVVPRVLAWVALAVVVALTVRARRSAVRAWLLLLAYVTLVCALFTVTRLSTDFAAWVGLAPRYVCDVLVVAAFCLGVALKGLRDEPDPGKRALPAFLRRPMKPAVVVVLVGLLASTAWSTVGFSDLWALKNGRDFLRTAQAELARAPEGTVFLDGPVPENVQAPLFYPYHLYSRFFLPAERQPTIVDIAEKPSVFDNSGRIRPAWVRGVDIRPGADPWCKTHKVAGGPGVRIPLANAVPDRRWVVRVGYLGGGDGESAAMLRLGDGARWFTVKPGLNQVFFLLDGGGGEVELTLMNPAVWVCTNDITIGEAVAWP